MIAKNTELEAAFGVKFNLRDSENTSIFGDVAVNRILGKAFLGGGLSAWDLTESDTRSIALLLQGGVDLTSNGKVQLAAQSARPSTRWATSRTTTWSGAASASGRTAQSSVTGPRARWPSPAPAGEGLFRAGSVVRRR